MSEEAVARITPASEKSAARRRPAALGRGLGALLGDTRREEPVLATVGSRAADSPAEPPPSGLAMLAVADIEPHPEQPRRHFDEAALDELAQSIAARGVIQPIVVRPVGKGRYQLVAGERRWRAAQRARLHEIPAIVRDVDNAEVAILALVENLQREDLNPVEEARAYQRLGDEQKLTQQDIAGLVDKSRSHVANMMRLLDLPGEVLEMIEDGRLSMGHARALVTVAEPAELAADVVARGLSVRETERLARKAQLDSAPSRGKRSRAVRDAAENADIAAMQSHLEEFLGLKVLIQPEADLRAGAVTIRYKSLDQLDLVCERLTGGGI
ncbi:MAG TPA: ParB/RepB/Spo0J family partition protein [Xanthobacteraceae bacterium]|nr:ParB/RepB/Spo0J family partition protein [Xanthobacteraceae bacterium]